MPKNRYTPDPAPDKARTFLARYGATVLRGGIAAIPTALFTYGALLELSPQETWFISYILAHKWDEDLPYPSLRRMAERTGLSVRQLHRIKDAIVEKGYLVLVPRHRAEDGGQDSNAYDFSGLFGRIEELLRVDGRTVSTQQEAPYPDSRSDPPPLRAVAAEAPPRRPTVSTRAPAPAPSMAVGPVTPATPGVRARAAVGAVTPMTPGPVTKWSAGSKTRATPGEGTTTTPGPETAPPPPPLSPESHEKRPDEKPPEKPQERRDSNHFSPFVMAVASDLSRELGDSAHEVANMTQANHLWQESGLDEAAFVALMQEARQRTRRAQGGQGHGLIENRAAYYFSVLRGLVGVLVQRPDPVLPDAGLL